MKIKVYILFLLFTILGFSQENEQNKFLSIGAGVVYFPSGRIVGFNQSYSFDYFFSMHFGLKLSADFGEGEVNDKYYFDSAKSRILTLGIVYAPFKKIKSLNINASFSNYRSKSIFGTKDERVDGETYLSQFTTYKNSTINGLNIGLQSPLYQNENFLFAIRIDGYVSWLQVDAATTKLVLGYKF